MATTTVSIGTNTSIDTQTPDGSTGGGPSYTVTFATTPTGISVGDIGFMDTEDAGGGNPSDYTFLVTAISGDDITMKYIDDTTSKGDASPFGLYDGTGTSGSPNQAVVVFKRAYSTIVAFEAAVDDVSPRFWGTTDDVIGELHADSTFTDATTTFDQKQSLTSVKLSVNADDRHDGTAESGALLKPTTASGHDVGILRVAIDSMTIEWIDFSLDSLDSTNTNKTIVLTGTNDDCIIRNNLMHDKYGNPGSSGPFMIHTIAAGAASDSIYILNNIIYNVEETSDDTANAVNTNLWGGNAYIYNNTVYNIVSNGSSKFAIAYRFGNPASSNTRIKNNIASKLDSANATGERAYEYGPSNGGAGTVDESNNISDDTSATAYDAGGTDSLIDQTLGDIAFVSTVAGSEDLHISSGSSAEEAGTDLGTTNEVEIDINGYNRDSGGVTWDIGAHQLSRAAGYGAAFLVFVDS